jgi:hypothetical protein
MVVPVFGRLGETELQCALRFGSGMPITDAGEARSVEFVKDDYIIVVTFLHRVSVCEAYKKKGGATPLSDPEVTELISKNGGANWQLIQGDQPGERWGPVDNASEEGATFQADTLIVWAPGAREALALLQDVNEKQNQAKAQAKAQQATSGL